MPRRPRLHIAGYPHHIVQRGHNRAACFFAEEDYQTYRHWLGEARQHGVACVRDGRYLPALEHFAHAQLADCDDPAVWHAYTMALWVAGQRDPQDQRAVEALYQLIQRAPNQRRYHNLGAMILLNKGRFTEALVMAQAANPQPDSLTPVQRLALLLAQGRREVQFDLDGARLRFALVTATTQAVESSIHHAAGQLTEREELQAIRAWVPQGGVVAEIGVCLGNHSAYFLQHLAPRRLIAFEADPLLIPHIERTLHWNNPHGAQIRLYHAFVGAQSGTIEFGGAQVPAVALNDALAEPVDFIKIDVDGGEIELLKAAETVLLRDRPRVMIEVEPQHTEAWVQEWFTTRGFRLRQRFDHGGYANLLFEATVKDALREPRAESREPRAESRNDSKLKQIAERHALSYHIPYAQRAEQMIGLRGKRVLEVGGNLPSELVLDYFGARQWVALQEPGYWQEIRAKGQQDQAPRCIDLAATKDRPTSDEYLVLLGDIHDLPAAWNGYFDVIFSIAAFEHIQDLGGALASMARALKPDGRLFSMFSPIWSAYDGHHLPTLIDANGQPYQFSTSPIPPWGHLWMTRSEMEQLWRQRTDQATAEQALYYIYDSPHINRLFTEDYIELVRASGLKGRIQRTFPTPCPADIKRRLQTLYPGKASFENNGLLFVLTF